MLFLLPGLAGHILGQTSASKPIIFQQVVAARTPGNRRSILRTDPIEAMIATGQTVSPKAGEKLGTQTWDTLTAGADNSFSGPQLGGGYVYSEVKQVSPAIMILQATGASVAYVNNEPRGGDPYQFGYVGLPVKLNKGTNSFLFSCGRGRFSAQLVPPTKPVFFDLRDATLPDLVPSVKGNLWAGVVVVNATESSLGDLRVVAESAGKKVKTTLGPVGKLTLRKFAIQLPNVAEKVTLRLYRQSEEIDANTLTLRKRKAGESYKRTFQSEIDGSAQYYGVQPSSKPAPSQALFLSLHGASVEGLGQAEAYAPKNWGYIVAPTNRRPYGFDWEDIGRLDALEVLDHAQREFRTDPRRTYLTGHSMGGHGSWQIGVHFPDRFAAVAPSAGWVSFWSYAGGGQYDLSRPMEAMLRRASSASDTLALKSNYYQQGIYVLHGDADDNVPVTEARTMRSELSDHPDLGWHEQKGAGHWWSEGNEPGARCVDWAPIFGMFSRRAIAKPSATTSVRFVTANPGVSARNLWVTIVQQDKQWVRSGAQLTAKPSEAKITGTTENVARLTLGLDALAKSSSVQVQLDDSPSIQTAWPAGGKVHLAKTNGRWAFVSAPSTEEKHPGRSGGFKDVFRNRVCFVVGTQGTPEENAWAAAKARYDAETLWYRGNGSVDVITDQAFLKARPDQRNVLLYGNATTNSAWNLLLAKSPVQVRRGEVTVGSRKFASSEFAVLFIYPRPKTANASVGVVSGTGLTGMRLTDRSPFFVSGAGMPDLMVYGPEMLREGSAGVRMAGFFGNQWDVDGGEFARN
ncbi:MAG: prolyl oligopeptidase family serine peptidase [Fimbriimonas sp.]